MICQESLDDLGCMYARVVLHEDLTETIVREQFLTKALDVPLAGVATTESIGIPFHDHEKTPVTAPTFIHPDSSSHHLLSDFTGRYFCYHASYPFFFWIMETPLVFCIRSLLNRALV